MRIFIDVDETICATPISRDYNESVPIQKNIDLANALYDEGHNITYYTARGAASGQDWKELTDKQLKDWGCKYHALDMHKPAYDLLIDDRVLNSRVWEENGNDVAKRVFLQAIQFANKWERSLVKEGNELACVMKPLHMGIGKLGDMCCFKRKFRWVFEAKFPDGSEIKPCFVRVNHRPEPIGDAKGIRYLGPIEITIYGIEQECELSQTIANITEQIFGNKTYTGEGKLILYDGCGVAVETWQIKELRIDQTAFDNYSDPYEFDITMRIQFDKAEYTNHTKDSLLL